MSYYIHMYTFKINMKYTYILQVLNLGDVRNMSNVSIQAHTHTQNLKSTLTEPLHSVERDLLLSKETSLRQKRPNSV
jgi:hypothetical protein